MNHRSSNSSVATGIICAFMLAAAPAAFAKDDKPPSNPVGAGWDTKVTSPGNPGSQTLSPDQMKSIEAVNTYFNGIQNLAGTFLQTNPDGKEQRGKFFLARPGRFRFDYNRPSRQIIVSDGTYLAIQDLDLKNEDVYGLENTPFRILLRDQVDLIRDASILAVQQSNDQIAVTITDKSPDSPGQITIYLTPEPTSELAGWVTTDVQGGVTKVKVDELKRPEKLNNKLFEREKLFMRSIQ